MRKQRITITISPTLIKKIDSIIDQKKILNRSHAIEFVLKEYFKPSINYAVILAGGKKIKKTPQFKLNSITLLEFQIKKLKEAGIKNIIFITNDDENEYKNINTSEINTVNLKIMKEKQPMGTAGTLLLAKPFIKGNNFIVLHGDVYTDLDFNDLIDYHLNQDQEYIGTIVLTTVQDPQKYGMATVKGTQIIGFKEKPRNNALSNLVSSGIYVFNKKLFENIKNKEFQSLEADIFPKLAKNNQLTSYIYQGMWADISYTDMYKDAIAHYKQLVKKDKS